MAPEEPQFPGSRTAISGLRYYNPSTGRWLSRDPIQEQGGLNPYGMVDNDSIDYYDRLGLAKSYGGCFTPEQIKTIEEAEAEAKEALEAAIAELKDLDVLALFLANEVIKNSKPRPDAFKVQIQNLTKSSISHLTKVYTALNEDRIVILCGDDGVGNDKCGSSFAYASDSAKNRAFGKDTIVICRPFYKADSQAGIIAHEISHAHAELARRHRTDVVHLRNFENMVTWPNYAEFPEEAINLGIQETMGRFVVDVEQMLLNPRPKK